MHALPAVPAGQPHRLAVLQRLRCKSGGALPRVQPGQFDREPFLQRVREQAGRGDDDGRRTPVRSLCAPSAATCAWTKIIVLAFVLPPFRLPF
jgi:hypothetical protein